MTLQESHMSHLVLTTAEFFRLDWISSFVYRVVANLDRRAKINDTIKELSKLSNKELNDIGISRGEIRSIAEESFPPVNKNLKGWV